MRKILSGAPTRSKKHVACSRSSAGSVEVCCCPGARALAIVTDASGWPYARGMSQAFNTLAGRLVDKLSAGLTHSPNSAMPSSFPLPPIPAEPEDKSPLQNEIDLDGALMEAANTLSVASHRLVPGLETESLDDGWDDWINGSLGPIHSRGTEDTGEVDMDTLLATIGGSSGWFDAMVESSPGAGQQRPGHQHHPPQGPQPQLPHLHHSQQPHNATLQHQQLQDPHQGLHARSV